MNRRTIQLAVAFAAPLLLLLASCGDDSSPTAASTPTQPAAPLTEAQLKPLLLTADEMPAGFTAADGDDDSADEPSGCKAADALVARTKDEVDNAVNFSRAADNAFVTETITVLDDANPATEFAGAKKAFASCKSLEQADGAGGTMKFTIEPLDVPALGDAAFGFTATAKAAGTSMIIQSTYVLVGDKAVQVDNMAVGTIDDALTTETLTNAVNKLKTDSKSA